jgi:hypothetical protein
MSQKAEEMEREPVLGGAPPPKPPPPAPPPPSPPPPPFIKVQTGATVFLEPMFRSNLFLSLGGAP